MIDGIEPLYQIIAEAIQEAIPEDWVTAKMDVFFFTGGGRTCEGEYIRKIDGKVSGFATPRNATKGFVELRRLFKEGGKPLFGQASIELHCDGKFNMKLGYDNCDKDGNRIFDEEEDMKRHEERRKRLTAE